MSRSPVSKCLQYVRTHDVELASIFVIISTVIGGIVANNLQIDAVCAVTRNNSEEFCNEIVQNEGNSSEEETAIQETVADVNTYASLVDNLLKLTFVLVVGPWGDIRGWRPTILLNVFGLIVSSASYMILSLEYDKMSPYLLGIAGSALSSVLGGELGYSMACSGYLSDITKENLQTRTFRFGMFKACAQLGSTLAFLLIGVMVGNNLSYFAIFGVGLGFAIFTLSLLFFGRDESPQKYRYEPMDSNKNQPFLTVLLSCLIQIFGFISEKLRTPGKERKRLVLILLLHILLAAPIHGESTIMYLFLRKELSWNIVNYGNFNIYSMFLQSLGVALAVGILNKWLKLSDPVIGLAAGISQFSASLFYAFAITAKTVYFAPLVSMFNGAVYVALKSMLSKVVPQQEVGKAIAFSAIFETVTPLTFIPLYNWVYKETVATYSTAVFLLSASITFTAMLILLWLFHDLKENNATSKHDIALEKDNLLGNNNNIFKD